ncbi:MAG: hypothetical protein JWO05_2848 [Gemmatimonadetes bacterium]|nr:hypothetical protein [Gemmatimonadota bacterium]
MELKRRCSSLASDFQHHILIMSHAYLTRTFTVASHELPSTLASLEEFDALKLEAGGRAGSRVDGLHHLGGTTRSGWAIYTTQGLLRSFPAGTALQFLEDSGQYRFETELGLTAVTVLDSAAVDAAAEQLDQLLSNLAADPIRVYFADDGGIFGDGEVEAALARDYVSANPAFDRQVGGDDGEGADYLFTYLRSMLALLRTAQAQQLSVVHSLRV